MTMIILKRSTWASQAGAKDGYALFRSGSTTTRQNLKLSVYEQRTFRTQFRRLKLHTLGEELKRCCKNKPPGSDNSALSNKLLISRKGRKTSRLAMSIANHEHLLLCQYIPEVPFEYLRAGGATCCDPLLVEVLLLTDKRPFPKLNFFSTFSFFVRSAR